MIGIIPSKVYPFNSSNCDILMGELTAAAIQIARIQRLISS